MDRSVTMRGNPLLLAGNEVRVGDSAPDARLSKNLAEEMQLSELNGRPRIYSVVPSVDTPVCADQTKRFNKEAANLPRVDFCTISFDLPTALDRFCGAAGIDKERITTLSDHRHAEFGTNYGTLIPAWRILCRAVFVIGDDDIVKYAEYVPEIAEHPNYEAILECARSL